jgi:hypothetical protein
MERKRMSVNKSIAQILAASAITFLAAHTFAGANAMMAGTTQLSLTKTISNYASASDADSVLVLAATAGPKEDVQATIKGQFLAFLEGDVNRAFTYASSSIRSMFGTAQNFGAMVQRSYPMVWRSAGVTFLEHRETSLGRTQDVKIVDVAGTAHYLRYFVTQTSSGWKISGVQFLNITDISV